MFMVINRKILLLSVIAGLILLGALSQTSVFKANGLDEAMQHYLSVVQDGDTAGFVDMLPTRMTFRFSSYSGRTGNLMAAENFTKEQVMRNFNERGGLYFSIFGGDSSYKYHIRVSDSPLGDWKRVLNVYRWEHGNLKSYVKWQQEGDEWKVIEVGDMVP